MANIINKDTPEKKGNAKSRLNNLDMQPAIREFLLAIGEDADAPNFIRTPQRVDEAIKLMLSGYDRSFEEEVWGFKPTKPYKDMILLKNIDYFSMCRHHLLPFFGYAHVAYIPKGDKVLGISKLARVIDIYAKRLQDQESISSQAAEALMKFGEAKGVAILMEGRHLCNVAKGVEKKVSIMSTCAFYGSFEKDVRLQDRFMDLVRERDHI